MGDHKHEYEALGHSVVIHHYGVDDYREPSAWVDGGTTAIYLETLWENQDLLPEGIADSLTDDFEEAPLNEVERVMAFLISTDQVVCKKCTSLAPYDDIASTGFAGIKCGDCARSDAECPENPNGDTHDMEVYSGRNNARRATKRRCKHCNYKNSSPPTG